MSSLKEFARIVVFGAPFCGFCKKAKTLLSNSPAKFSYFDAEEHPDMILDWQNKQNYHKVPMIFID